MILFIQTPGDLQLKRFRSTWSKCGYWRNLERIYFPGHTHALYRGVWIHKILCNTVSTFNCACMCASALVCVCVCLCSHSRVLSAASDQQFWGGQRSGSDQWEDAAASRCRQQRGPVDGPYEHGRAQWDRQQQQSTVMDVHAHAPTHTYSYHADLVPYFILCVHRHIYRQEKCITHTDTHTHNISFTK